jgi:protein-L-isoaspartate(D-aspartate) O-methyltransferase
MQNSEKKNWLLRLMTPGTIITLVVLLGIITLFILQNHSNNTKIAGAQSGIIQQSTNQASILSVGSKNNQVPIFDVTKRPNGPSTSSEADYLKWMLANTSEKQDYLTAKWQRMQAIIKNQDANDPRVLQAFLRTPRELFFSAKNASKAYASIAVSIGYGQTISGPQLVARMTQTIDPQPNQRVLEIGTGSGYQSAVLSELSNYVYTIEIVPQLAQKDDALYTKLTKQYPEYANIKRKNADGYYGWSEYAPFDRIIVTAGIDHVPPDLLAQLAPGGIMVIPVGPPSGQTILKITKTVLADGSVTFTREDIYHGKKVVFVPFTAGQGIHSNGN